MPNTLTNLIPDAYAALDVVSRELTGFIPGVTRDPSTDRAALNQTIRSHATRKNSAGTNITPAMAIPAAADQTVDNVPIEITKARAFPFSWSGEEIYGMDQGPGFLNIRQDQIAQALRAAVNEIELDLAVAAYKGASNVRKILDDNGAPMSARSLVIDTAAGAKLRTLGQLTKANEAGTSMTLRDGELLNLHGFSVRESAQVQRPAVGTSTTAIVATGGVALGATSIVLKAAGTGTIVAGDVITIADDTNQYIVTEGAAAVSGATIKIAAPGLQKAIVGEKAITIVASGARNVAFSQDALLLATRLPIVPPEGDLSIESEVITDSRSGLSFELRVYPGYRMNRYEVAVCWGVKAIKAEHMALLID